MSPQRFDALRERLLRAGIAPRHVRRYIGELGDHLEDLVREETANGLTRDAAETQAHTRLGGDDALATALLAKPGLRSIAARFPWAVFGIGAAGLLLLVFEAALLAEVALLQGHLDLVRWQTGVQHPPAPEWLKLTTSVWNWLMMYAAPLLVAAFMAAIAIRQRMGQHWIVTGLVIVAIVGGMLDVGIAWSDVPAIRSELSVSFELTAPISSAMIVSGLARTALTLALAGAAYFLWARRGLSAATQ